jgi:hypothetical protein
MHYKNPLVRDLAWALSSPPLLQRSDPHLRWLENGWFKRISEQYGDVLEQLDKDPRPLQEMVDARKDRRLGNYFETLWRFWLNSNRRYRLLFANLPLQSGSRTLGEFDFLVKDEKTGKTLHWEIAVKFYLGVSDTSQPANWLGPAQRDRLDIKTSRLLNHQGRLSHRPEAVQLFEQLGIQVDETWLILKGRLFYPAGVNANTPHGAYPDHLRGFWIDQCSLSSLGAPFWLPLERHQWLAPLTRIDPAICLDNRALIEKWQHTPLQYPVCIARVIEGVEVERGFVVADNWSSRTRVLTPEPAALNQSASARST